MKSQSLSVERLEERTTPTIFGMPWPDASHLTISFAPDGTSVNGRASQLFGLLNATESTAAWQDAVLRAFQTWAANANINITVVPDGGQPMGSGGAIQGDPRFGDIRISAVPLSPNIVAQAMPFNVTAGTWSGDVELNSNYQFGNGAAAGQYDLFTVMLHEAGHVFGLPHSDDPASPMFEDFTAVHTGLTAPDVAALQALYGARLPDNFDAKAPNDSPAVATRITPASQAVLGDLTTLNDVDWYQIKTQGNSSTLVLRLQTTGQSLLLPRLNVFDANLNLLGSFAATEHLGNDLLFQLDSVSPGAVFYAQVASGTTDVFGIGSYQLFVTTGDSANTNQGGSAFWQGVVNDNHTNDSFATATVLAPKTYQADARFDYTYNGSISDPADVDLYRVKAPKSLTGTTTAVTVMVWTQQQPASWSPRVTVYDVFGNPVAAQILMNENGTYSLQVANAMPNMNYYVSVSGATFSSPMSNSNYFLGIDFGSQANNMQTFAANTLPAAMMDTATLQLAQSSLFHFVLSANSPNTAAGAAVQLTITDALGNNVATVTAAAGDSQSLTLLLGPGQYNLTITAIGQSSPVSYTLWGLTLSDGIGPRPVDTTTNSTPSGSGTSGSTGYIWQNGLYSFLGLI